jgi:RNA 2',3'-cyclic 3'-phosphodiesterase
MTSGSPPEAKPLRLFVAVDVPDDVKAGVAAFVSEYRTRVPVARWTGEAGWHVTLKFLGSTWPRSMETVREGVAAAAEGVASFETRITEAGVFPSARRARVVWAGLDDASGAFRRLSASLDSLLAEIVEPERRPFTPHLTLARLNPPRDIGEFAPDLVGRPVTSRTFSVDRLVLYRSHLSPRGATYESLQEAALIGG